ncbi:IgGFc-binding protein-like protein, partial [Lates japonicus]
MEIKGLLVCLAAALLAVCHGCSTGKEFITTFLPNYQRTSGANHRLHVVLTAQGSAANVHIQVASVSYSRQLTLSAGQSRWVSLPCGSELHEPFVTANSAVRISSSAKISVVSFNRRFATGDGAVVSPKELLGTNYFVYTPSGGGVSMDKLFAIVNDNNYNKITIIPSATVKLRGSAVWTRGKAVTITLAPYASYLVRSHATLTGTQIQSQHPVAVLAGHQCLSMGGKCEHVYEQLPPVERLGKHYLVPMTGAPPPTPSPNPCEDVKCRVKEHCVNGVCVHTSTATCSAMGDPHYQTFDGQRYDFQGSCTYIMATVAKKASDLVPFTVTTKNNHRGSRRVSYVRTVAVSVHQQTIVIGSHAGRVEVNGELQHLPVSLLDGKVSVKRSGIYAVLRTDFGLTIKYDWNMRLYITVPSSYYEHLGGLCGNYNGDRNDDVPGGSHISTVLKMIQQWKVKDPDLFCHDNCGGHCPQCSLKQQDHYRHPTRCGLLTKADGPFSACHKTVDPTMYVDNCIYDICINKGAKWVLCDSLKSYADDCLSEGVKITPEWRAVSKCPLPCPAGSHYEACGSACPASCTDLDSEAKCKDQCVEGCQCDKGLVLSGDRDCYPASYSTCQGTGDPHYQSFDNRRFDFQGTCTYVLSQHTKGSGQDLVPFQVLVQNENRGRNKAVAYTKSVSLTVFDITISMSRANPGKVLVNSQSVNLPYSVEDGKLSLFRKGYFGVVTTSFGLTLRFNWNSHVSLTLPSSYSDVTTGLCGNYNGKHDDDLLKPDGTQAKHVNAFGHSWKTGGDPGCTSDCPGGKCPECEPALLVRYQEDRYCGIIADKSGPFKQCHSKLDHKPFLSDCVFDLCMYKGHVSALCNSLSAFSTSCQEAGATVESWRTEQFCPASCGENSHYEVCAPPCQVTCSGLAAPEGCDESAPCTEGCVCDDGFVLSHDKCVPIAECGCQYEGQYYQNEQVFYPEKSCNTRCVCSDGNVQCDTKFRCSPNEKCDVKDGVATCTPKGVGSCSVSGVRMVRSFDGM